MRSLWRRALNAGTLDDGTMEPRVTGARLETERLLLRWFTLDDLEAFYELASNPRIIRYVGNQPLASLDVAREALVAAPLTDYASYGYAISTQSCSMDDKHVSGYFIN
jgi:hypothetical protein